MADSKVWTFLQPHLDKRGFTREGGGQTRLRVALERYDVSVTAQAVSQWFNGGSMKLASLLALLDLLDVHGADRAQAIDLAAGRVDASDIPEKAEPEPGRAA